VNAVEDLAGLTLAKVWRGEWLASDALFFETSDGRTFCLYHDQDCCESVTLDDVAGDLDDLVGSPLVIAEEVSNDDAGYTVPERDYVPESETWTFYKFATAKGYVTLRWHGESNGYYSESVSFIDVTREVAA